MVKLFKAKRHPCTDVNISEPFQSGFIRVRSGIGNRKTVKGIEKACYIHFKKPCQRNIIIIGVINSLRRDIIRISIFGQRNERHFVLDCVYDGKAVFSGNSRPPNKPHHIGRHLYFYHSVRRVIRAAGSANPVHGGVAVIQSARTENGGDVCISVENRYRTINLRFRLC
jgi:hypothetical protein